MAKEVASTFAFGKAMAIAAALIMLGLGLFND